MLISYLLHHDRIGWFDDPVSLSQKYRLAHDQFMLLELVWGTSPFTKRGRGWYPRLS